MTNDNRDQFEKQNTRYQRALARRRRQDALLILAIVVVAVLAAVAMVWPELSQ